MSKDLKSPQPSEEVDLGQLFKLVGKMFDRFFRFISKIFQAVFGVVLVILIHFRKRFFWYVGAAILGLISGYILDETADKEYGANMFIETNFRSSRQVYENIKDLQQLAFVDKDTIELAKRLHITPSEAASLNGFYIQPDLDENNSIEMYSKYYAKLDSVSRIEINYEKYKKSLTPYNFNMHLIGVTSKDKFIYKKIEKAFVDYLAHNAYLTDVVQVNTENLNRENQSLLLQIQKTDSLAQAYLKIRVEESKKKPIPGAGTNLYLGGETSQSANLIVDESKVIEKRLEFEAKRRAVYKNLVDQKNVINMLSGFPNSGYDIRTWKDRNIIILPMALIALLLLVFLGIYFRNYVDKQTAA